MTPREMLDAATTLVLNVPGAELIRHRASGNLLVVENDSLVGLVDLRNGSVQFYEEPKPLNHPLEPLN
jgi:hypothetical protein